MILISFTSESMSISVFCENFGDGDCDGDGNGDGEGDGLTIFQTGRAGSVRFGSF